jgi:GTP-binding protein
MFVDRAKIQVTGGDGGDGCLSFRRERYIPRGGPDGGDGGNGGSVIVRAESDVNHLSAVAHRKHWRAKRGGNGEGSDRHGRNAEDLLILVPPGTVVTDCTTHLVIKDLLAEGDQVCAARGGHGGKGNTHFKSSTNRVPRQFTKGEKGELRDLILELKVIADVGLIGKPNAGKSTLLSRLSRARPEIASYPFTTKFPNLGQVSIDADRSFVMADIPGLIEGAHTGHGLGHEFLRHVQRAGILVHLVEPAPLDGTDPIENYRSIRNELQHYDEELGSRPEVVAISKCELPDSEATRARLAETVDGPVLSFSAVTGQGLNELVGKITEHLSGARDGQE